MKFDKMQSAGYLANHMARLFAQGLHERIKPFGIAPAQFVVLLELWRQEGLTQRELVERLDVEQATMANTIARMERDGLLVREPHPQDKRANCLYLTDKAKDLQDAATKAAREQNAVALASFDAAEKDQFLELMRRAISAMSKSAD